MTGRRLGEAFAARQQQIVRRRRRRSKRSHRGTPPKIYEDGKYYTDREQADDDVDLYTGQCKSHQGQEESPEEDIASSAGDIASSAGDIASSAGDIASSEQMKNKATNEDRTLGGNPLPRSGGSVGIKTSTILFIGDYDEMISEEG